MKMTRLEHLRHLVSRLYAYTDNGMLAGFVPRELVESIVSRTDSLIGDNRNDVVGDAPRLEATADVVDGKVYLAAKAREICAKADLREALELLRSIEWHQDPGYEGEVGCPFCGGIPAGLVPDSHLGPTGHEEDCRLNAFLKRMKP